MKRDSRMTLAALVLALSMGCKDEGPALFSIQLPELIGPIAFDSATFQRVDFDFGQEFSEIESVSIRIEAHRYAKSYEVCGTVFDPQPCETVVHLLGFIASLDREDSPIIGLIYTDGILEPETRTDLEGFGRDRKQFNNTRVGWDFLADGAGTLRFAWNDLLGDPDRIIENVVEPSGEIFDARLTIEGTPKHID